MDLEGKHQFKFCTLPGIVILKLLAWDDRPEKRQGDILDISDILQNYFSMHDQEIWNNHFDLFTGIEQTIFSICFITGLACSLFHSGVNLGIQNV